MKTIKTIIILLLQVILLASCEKDIEFSGKVTNPLIVVNSIISPDSAISAEISKSKFFLANDETFDSIKNADVSLYINGSFKEKMSNVAGGLYKSNYIPNSGDTVLMKVASSGMQSVNCQTIITSKPEIISVDTAITSLNYYPTINYKSDQYGNVISQDTTAANLNYQLKVKIKIHDNVKEKNYYRITSQVHQPANNSNSYGYTNITFEGALSDSQNNSSDILGISSSSNMYNIFSDELFNGKDYFITCNITGYSSISLSGSEAPYLYINLQNINDDYYKYLYTKNLSYSSDGFFSEPVQIYNNVNNGIGILGAYNNGDNSIKINLKDLLRLAKIGNSSYNGYSSY